MTLLTYLFGFIWILFASAYASKFFQRIKLPLITGFLVAGMICGPYILGFLPKSAVVDLSFINDLALAFIAFAAGNELFVKDIQRQFKSIVWNVFGQLVVTFLSSALAIFFLADYIPFMSEMDNGSKIAVAILVATIFIARSPSSAIAVINEMRAKGPFTQMAIGVTVIKDVLVIMLFAICFSIARSLISGEELNVMLFLILFLELGVALGLGYVLAKVMTGVFGINMPAKLKGAVLLLLGFGIFYLSHFVAHESEHFLGFSFHFEPLLACIYASFYVTNYSRHRIEFQTFIEEFGLPVYAAFFTYTGFSLSIDVLQHVWLIALVLFGVRLVSLILGAWSGATLAKDPALFKRIGWMPFVTQAGVGLGLATEVANEFPAWGAEFTSIIIAVIVVNQFVGPPLFKWSLLKVKEAHIPAKSPDYDGQRDVFIFGLETQGWALAKQLANHGWNAELVGTKGIYTSKDSKGFPLHQMQKLDLNSLEAIDIRKGDAVVLLLTDEDNLKLANLIREEIGIKEIIVKLNDRKFFEKFHDLGVLIVEPSTAIVSLLDQFVRSPVAASLLLGSDEAQQTADIEVRDQAMHGMFIRDLRLPLDCIILSVKRKGEVLISHGYTRLRIGDIVSIVGSQESLDKIQLRFDSL